MEAPQPLLGRYRFLKMLRGGAKAPIWLATDESSERTVVAAIVPAARVTGITPLIRFEHPHLATVLDIVESPSADELPTDEPPRADGQVVVAEYVAGRTMHQRLESGALNVAKAVQTIARLSRALDAIHRRGGFHAAVSPRSVLVSRAELGVAPVLTQLLAPPNGAYCCPERVTGGGPSEADDVWALAATFYAALTARPPFTGESRKELARMILAGRPIPLTAFGIEEPELQDVVDRGLAAKPAGRFAHASEVGAALDAWVQSKGEDAAPPPSMHAPPPMSETAPPPPAVDDEGISDAILRPESPEANSSTSTAWMPAVRPSARGEPPPSVEVERPSVDDQEDILVALAQQPSAEDEPRLVDSQRPTDEVESDRDRTPTVRPAAPEASAGATSELAPPGEGAGDLPSREEATPVADATADAESEATPATDAEPSARTPEMPDLAALASPRAPTISSPEKKSSSSTPWIVLGGVVAVAAVVAGVMLTRNPDGSEQTATAEPPAPGTTSPSGQGAEATTKADDEGSTRTDEGSNDGTAAAAPSAEPDAATKAAQAMDHEEAAVAGAEIDIDAFEEPAGDETDEDAAGEETTSDQAEASGQAKAPPSEANIAVCVASYFPPDTFASPEGFDFLCSETDPRRMAASLYKKVVLGGRGKLTEGMKLWSRLGWYELATVAVTRAGCCPGAAPLEVPLPTEPCADLTKVLVALGDARQTSADVSEQITAFHDDILCIFVKQVPRPFRYGALPTGANRHAFEELLEHAPAP